MDLTDANKLKNMQPNEEISKEAILLNNKKEKIPIFKTIKKIKINEKFCLPGVGYKIIDRY
jgi:hypothetical protein